MNAERPEENPDQYINIELFIWRSSLFPSGKIEPTNLENQKDN